jgi:hypothetical protein
LLADAVRYIIVQPKNGKTPGVAPGHNQSYKQSGKKQKD